MSTGFTPSSPHLPRRFLLPSWAGEAQRSPLPYPFNSASKLPAPSTLETLKVRGGEVIIDGATIDLTSTAASDHTGAMNTEDGGDITIRNGADVRLSSESPSMAVIDDGTLTVTGSGTSLTGRRLDTAKNVGDLGNIIVEDGASVAMNTLIYIGFEGSGELVVQTGGSVSCGSNMLAIGIETNSTSDVLVTGSGSSLYTHRINLGGANTDILGGTGELTITDGGFVQARTSTKFWSSSSSIIVNGGTLETKELTEHTGVTGDISISNPGGGGKALTVGIYNASSTFNGVIKNAAGGAGTLKKMGTGTLTLNGANTYTGGTDIDAGTVQVGTGGTTGSIVGNVANSGALVFDRSNTLTFGGVVSGTGSLTQSGNRHPHPVQGQHLLREHNHQQRLHQAGERQRAAEQHRGYSGQ